MIIDPPGGWKYGFPRPIPVEELKRVREWLVENGYPQKEMDSYGEYFYYRTWSVPEGKDESEKG
jgi:hypothetical protein